jgi:hypothetical protein
VVRPRPWTVQERVADFAQVDGRAFLAVNGYGVTALTLGPDGFPHFQPFYDPLLFGHRTLAGIFSHQGTLLCHLYFNSLLNEVSPESLPTRGISLLRLFPSDGIYRLQTPPFQRRNPEWECVGFVPGADGQALLSWKLSGPRETRFAYTRLDLAGGSEREARQAAYREAMAFAPVGRGVEAGLRAIASEAVRRLGRASTVTGLQFLVREEGRVTTRRYQILPHGFQESDAMVLVLLPVEHRGGRFLLLTPDGALLEAAEGSARVSVERLPPLPEGCVYTDLLLADDGHLLAAWERRDFTDVGAAGLLVWKDPPISP